MFQGKHFLEKVNEKFYFLPLEVCVGCRLGNEKVVQSLSLTYAAL